MCTAIGGARCEAAPAQASGTAFVDRRSTPYGQSSCRRHPVGRAAQNGRSARLATVSVAGVRPRGRSTPTERRGVRAPRGSCRGFPALPGEGAWWQHESSWRRRYATWTHVEMLIVETAASRGYHGLGGATSRDDPGHHLSEVRALRKDRCTLDDVASRAVRACQASYQCADCLVFHTVRLLCGGHNGSAFPATKGPTLLAMAPTFIARLRETPRPSRRHFHVPRPSALSPGGGRGARRRSRRRGGGIRVRRPRGFPGGKVSAPAGHVIGMLSRSTSA